jgi:hypothetical protein
MLLGTALLAPAAAADVQREQQIKAAFVYNFLQFVRWPDDAFKHEKSPIVIAVIDNDAFFDAVRGAVRAKTVNGRAVEVIRFTAPAEFPECHLLFVGAVADRDRTADLLRRSGGKPVLSVGEGEAFTRAGGVIRFFTEANRMRFEVSLNAARRQRLELSAKLLKLARIFEE